MLLLLLSSLFVLNSGLPMKLTPQRNLTGTDNMKNIFDAKQAILDVSAVKKGFDAQSLIEELADADPAKVAEVVALVQAMLDAAQADLSRLTLLSTDADSAYDDAVSTYDAAVVAQTTGVAALAQAVTDAQSAKDVAAGARTGAQTNLDAEKSRLESEIASLEQVITILGGLTTGSAGGWYGDIDGGGWQLVRRVKAGLTWHPATDQCHGSSVYGTFVNDPVSDTTFSKQYDNINYNQFLFSTGDGAKWLVATKDAVFGGGSSGLSEWYGNQQRPILMASDNASPHTAAWYLRNGSPEDPWVSLTDHGSAIGQGNIIYGENNFASTHASAILPHHQGANVFIRYKA
jgi:hypothetical protein